MNGKDSLFLRRTLVGIMLPMALVAMTILPLLLFQARLPDPVATHWGFEGQPNDNMAFAFLVAFETVFVTVPAFGLVWATRRSQGYPEQIVRLVAMLAFIATMVAATSWSIVLANLDVEDWTLADQIGIPHAVRAVLVAALVAATAARLAKCLETAPVPRTAIPSAGLTAGARAVWVGTARSKWALPISVGTLAAAVYFMMFRGQMFGLPLAIVGLVALPFVSLRLVADRRGLRIRYGPLGWPRQSIPLGNIERATSVDVVPLAHGGWGYRGSLKLFGRASIVLRGGEGLKLNLTGDKVLTITIDNANEAAGLINDLVGASGAGQANA